MADSTFTFNENTYQEFRSSKTVYNLLQSDIISHVFEYFLSILKDSEIISQVNDQSISLSETPDWRASYGQKEILEFIFNYPILDVIFILFTISFKEVSFKIF